MSEKTIALLGQPNSGKSTLFNGLTGSRQHVGNWPGKTVERKDGSFVHKDTTYKIIDLPGTYSLSANSDEEVVTRNYIASGQADVVCILADASQLNRSLFMLADYTGIRVPVVLLLNMMDVAKSQGKQIDTNGIAKSLGIPVVPLVAADKKQYGTFFRMLESIDKNASTLDEKRLAQIYQNTIGAAFDEIKALLPADGIGIYSSTWLTAKLIEQDKLARSLVKETVDAGTYTAIEKKLSDVKDGNLLTGDCKFQWIDKLVNENVTSKKNKLLRSRFDKAATSKRWGKPHWKSLFGSVFSKMGNVLSRALRIIICISVIFWLLSYSADGNVANSIIYKVGTFIEPVTSLFGLPWQLFIAFVASAMGKEASLGVMASLFNTGSIWAAIEQSATVDTAALSTSMLSVISRPEALAFLFAFFFNMPCLMALTATTQETHSMKWTVRIALYYVLTALIMATIAYHVGLVIF